MSGKKIQNLSRPVIRLRQMSLVIENVNRTTKKNLLRRSREDEKAYKSIGYWSFSFARS